MTLHRVVGYYDSRARWLQSSPLPEFHLSAIEELAFLIPREGEVLNTFGEMKAVLAEHSIESELIEAGEHGSLARYLAKTNGETVFWNMTDGFYPVTASYFPAFAAMRGHRYFGNSSSLQLAVQNKFLQYIICGQLGIKTPETYLYDGSTRISAKPPQEGEFTFFVKPFDLANSIGIFNDSVCDTLDDAVAVAVRIKQHYRTKTLIQRYVPGTSIRVNYVAVNRGSPVRDCLGIHRMQGPPEPDNPFSTFEAHVADFAKADADYAREAVPTNVAAGPEAIRYASAVAQIQEDVDRLVRHFALRDFFSMDYKITGDGSCYFLELNTLPFARNAGLRAYCREAFGLTVGGALAHAIMTGGPEWPREW
jgi:D-alanine-D-alanine ligase-like ATP-grasp enzyme